MKGALIPPRELNPAIPPDMEALLLSALATERADRLASPAALGSGLERSLARIAPSFSAATLSQHPAALKPKS